MGYYQMTINDWLSMKQKLQAELLGVRRSFVRIGYMLRKIDEVKGYENDGYKSIAEWAKGEYGLEGSTVSRFMAINREYSIGGFSEELLPQFEDFKRSQLEEMLKLPMEDREMIRPETARQDIRDLKQFNKQTPAAGEADDIHQLVQKFFAENSDTLKEVYEVLGNTDAMKEVVNPSGNRSYRKGVFFLMMYEDGIKLKKFGGSPETYTWQQFFDIMTDIYGMELEKGEEKTDEGRDAETENIRGDDGRGTEVAGGENPGDGETAGALGGGTERVREMAEGAGTDSKVGEAEDESTVAESREEPEAEEIEAAELPADGEIDCEKGGDHGYLKADRYSDRSGEGSGEPDNGKHEDSGREENPGGADQEDKAGDASVPGRGRETGPDAEVHGISSESPAGSSRRARKSGKTGSDVKKQRKPEPYESTAAESKEKTEVEAADASENDDCAGAKYQERLDEEPISEDENSTFINPPEIVEKPFGTRKEYMDSLTEWGMALYLKECEGALRGLFYDATMLEQWLKEPVDERGRAIWQDTK